MATWIIPKTTWLPTDYINYSDYNRIKNNVLYLLGATSSAATKYPYSLSVYWNSGRGTVRTGNSVTIPALDCKTASGKRLYMPYGVRTVTLTYNGHTSTTHTYPNANGIIPARTITAHSYTGNITYSWSDHLFQWGVTSLPELYNMGSDKAVNDLWYADEFNTILDNIDLIAEIIGQNYDSRPFYYPNGHTPTALELQGIERKIQLLYNRIGRLDNLYLGSGYLGSRMSNRIL